MECNRNVEWRYGLDLVGYESENGAIVRSRWDTNANREIVSEIVSYLPKQNSNNPVNLLGNNDGEFILNNNYLPLVIDAPIESLMQPPDSEKNWRQHWEYYLRDVDKYFNGKSPGGLEPLPTRAKAIREYFNAKNKNQESLNTELFETYPAATIHQLYRDNNEDRLIKEGKMTQYKGSVARWDQSNKKWTSFISTKKNATFVKLLDDFSIKSSINGMVITDDEFDALLSSLVLLSHKDNEIFSEKNNNNPVYRSMASSPIFQHRQISGNKINVASGYKVVTKKFWNEIHITEQKYVPKRAEKLVVKYILENKDQLTKIEEKVLKKIISGKSMAKSETDRFQELIDLYSRNILL